MNLFRIIELLKKRLPVFIGALFLAIFATIFSVFDEHWYILLQAVKIDAAIFAIVVGGGWAMYLFLLQRQNQPAVGIKFDHKCISNGDGLCLACFDITLSNIGKVRVQGRRSRNPAYPIEGKDRKDKEETLKFAGSLLLRPVPLKLPQNAILDWFNQESGEKREQLQEMFFDAPPIEADLLYDYAIRENGTEVTDFWMEPGEAYDVGVSAVLHPGMYLAIVTFLGEKSDDELWRRKVIIEVPVQGQT